MSAFLLSGEIMIPTFYLFGKPITVYMIMTLAGIFTVLWYSYHTAEKRGLDEFQMEYALLFGMGGALLGAHILHGFTDFPLMLETFHNFFNLPTWRERLESLIPVFGGAVFYGGLIGGLIAGYLYFRHTRVELEPYADIAAVSIPMFHTFGRIGCFLSGCCYGIPWEHGVTYTCSPIPSANGVARFPVQLVEASLNLILCLVLMGLLKRGKLKGHLLHLYLMVYPVYRFLLEFLRGDEYRGFLFGLSTSQLISLVILVVVGIDWISAARQQKAGADR